MLPILILATAGHLLVTTNYNVDGALTVGYEPNELHYATVCNPKKFCTHNVRKYTCRECGGGGHCTHGIYKKYCKTCGGRHFAKALNVRHVATGCTEDTAYIALSICVVVSVFLS